MNVKPSLLLAGFCWLNFAGLIWLQLLGVIEVSPASGLATALFFVIAVFASVMKDK